MTKVSIIIPIYNVGKYLNQCLDSILAQTYTNWEAILIDDGSTDASSTICDMYKNKDNRFIVIHKNNEGAARAKNTGLDNATGNYIAFLDSDDYVEKNWLETCLNTMHNESADIVEYSFDKIYKNRVENEDCFLSEKIFSAEEYLAQYLDLWTCSLFSNKIFSSQLVDLIRFKNERRCIDDEFFTYKVIMNSNKIVRINNVLYHYRQRKSSAVFNKKNQYQITNDALDILVERYSLICNKFPNLRSKYLNHNVQIMFYFATLDHNYDTYIKFRKIARYYLLEILRYLPFTKLMIITLKLQILSKREILKEKESKEMDMVNHFE